MVFGDDATSVVDVNSGERLASVAEGSYAAAADRSGDAVPRRLPVVASKGAWLMG
jgi:hypothetical protein